MCLGISTLVRAFIYIVAVALAFIGGRFKLRLTALASLFFLAGGLYILTALLYPPVPGLVKSDIRNILVGCAILGTLGLSDLTWEAWKHLQAMAHRTVLIVSTIGALLGLAKLIYYNQGGVVPFLMDPERGYPLGSSLRMDYNFYALSLLLGMLSAFWLMKRDLSARWCTTALLCLPALVLAALLSGSRRGLIIVVCAIPILSVWLVIRGRHTLSGQRGAGISWKAVLAGLCLAAFLCALKLDSLTKYLSEAASADSFSDVMTRWATLGSGTYSDSRMHYWTVTMNRLSRFEPLDYVIGEGFAYTTDLGADPDLIEDYPHNFLLSSMLYGGVMQTGCLIAVVSIALTRLSRSSQGCGMFAAWFALVVCFLLTSCNSFFSSEIAVFLAVFGLGIRRFRATPDDVPSARLGQLVRQAA
jgi:hypothetical protein